ncbi:glutamate--tRNA ligase [Buchnera aphidicola (Hyperomyzus lactucae)]|uniref:Glutamate--tRNA ligase n=1 Tax=Buchnera aphidicola (Hyperomyzus lactucae) TaxID=1241860 RepID=A0A4D6Y2N4_9GAMM|nr:glutamate--tRNA ligase [Buchnera aphidicola]QCI20814.1 glutamate--tRNA ligase [Buchnera aphidicola (Hyperomyzus lactucae)]
MKVKTRFAPSPTGNLHIGSIRTALYSWLFAKHYNGEFVLRIEDTDLKRSASISIDSILNGLKWLGLDWDEGPYFQSKRLNRYKEVINGMLETGDAYICICSSEKVEETRIKQMSKGCKPRYLGTCRNLKLKNLFNQDYVVRFKNPLFGKVKFKDKIRGEITFNNEELDDLIIQRSNGIPTYNFCVVIDDLDMNITHVIRGEDHINNTPRQINILKSLGAKIPIYAHLSMILDEKGQKISKRKNAMNIIQYRENGFLPEALLNYVIRLGWSYGNKEIFDISEMKELFNLKCVSRSSSIINVKKLLWLNKYYINHLPLQYVSDLLKNYMKKENINIQNGPNLESLVKLFRNRYHTLKEITESCRYFYEEFNDFSQKAAEKYLIIENRSILEEFYKKIKNLSIWNHLDISQIINNLSLDMNLNTKKINMILRTAVTGDMNSPSISDIIYLINREKTLLRIQKAINYIKKISFKN